VYISDLLKAAEDVLMHKIQDGVRKASHLCMKASGYFAMEPFPFPLFLCCRQWPNGVPSACRMGHALPAIVYFSASAESGRARSERG